jgi:uncharacterized protein (UPF0332 family)
VTAKADLSCALARSEAALRAADALIPLGLCADSISRAYYAVFHALRALASARGVEARTHDDVIHVFNTELVRSGLFSSSHNRVLARLQRSRELADHDAAVVFSPEDAAAALDEARSFVGAARDWCLSSRLRESGV